MFPLLISIVKLKQYIYNGNNRVNVAFLVGNGGNCLATTDEAPITYVLGCRGEHATCVSLRWVRETL